MSLVELELPSPRKLRGGWAAFAAVCAARGWTESVYAESNRWYYDDGGGNWTRLFFHDDKRAVLIGHDHEYSETYFREAAAYFDEEETNLLAGAPDWWEQYIPSKESQEWIGFIYGWNGEIWQRAPYDKNDGFNDAGLLDICSIENTNDLVEHAEGAPGLNGQPPPHEALLALIAADANITNDLLKAVVPGWDIQAGIDAGRKFLEAVIH